MKAEEFLENNCDNNNLLTKDVALKAIKIAKEETTSKFVSLFEKPTYANVGLEVDSDLNFKLDIQITQKCNCL